MGFGLISFRCDLTILQLFLSSLCSRFITACVDVCSGVTSLDQSKYRPKAS